MYGLVQYFCIRTGCDEWRVCVVRYSHQSHLMVFFALPKRTGMTNGLNPFLWQLFCLPWWEMTGSSSHVCVEKHSPMGPSLNFVMFFWLYIFSHKMKRTSALMWPQRLWRVPRALLMFLLCTWATWKFFCLQPSAIHLRNAKKTSDGSDACSAKSLISQSVNNFGWKLRFYTIPDCARG
jgi:hypothetical protein